MRKKNILLIVVSSLLLLSIILHTPIGSQLHLQTIKPVKATSAEIIVQPGDSIQEAINNASTGDTILVKAGTYNEHVVVNKTVTLIGENRSTTIIDGEGTGIVILSNASNVEIRGFMTQNGDVFAGSGVLLGRRSIGNIIRDNIIRNNAYGITLVGSNGCSIIDNIIMNNSWVGIQIRDSSNNNIYENTMASNSYGVWITSPSSINNTLYHNNFIDNLNPPQPFGLDTTWDNGTEGNYWDDYTGVDTNGDGVGDTPHMIGLVTDSYPLIIPTRPFPVVIDGEIYLVALLSNSTVSSFYFSQPSKKIGFYVNGPLNTNGFCNITIPTALMNGTYKVFVNGTEVSYILYSNATHSSIYFTYNHSTQEVLIIPEFSATIFLLLFIILTLVTVTLKREKKGTLKL